jgi:hypothetical protein
MNPVEYSKLCNKVDVFSAAEKLLEKESVFDRTFPGDDETFGCNFKSKEAKPVEKEDELVDLHRNAPRPSPDCLFGLIGDIARAGSDHTEANEFAVAMMAISYIGTALGRGPYMHVGDDWHHTNGFFLHVGRSGRGRKGTAQHLVKRIDKAVRERSEHHSPQLHTGGLSSREGLAFLVHDGWLEGKKEVPPIEDKRLLVIESELANLLHQSSREGNTISSAIRDTWDGGSIKPAIKGSRVWATHPHISILANITPFELLNSMKARELSNGFANRFLIIWAERSKVLAQPLSTPQSIVDSLASRIIEILNFVNADRHVDKNTIQIKLSIEADTYYEKLYYGELNDCSSGEMVNGLLERRAAYLKRLAMIFALTDLSDVVQLPHIKAALAWVRYWSDSVKFIFQTAIDEKTVEEVSDTSAKVLAYLEEKGEATRWELSKDCFQGHVSKHRLDAAIDELLSATPPEIEVEKVPQPKGVLGRPTKKYKLTAKLAKLAKYFNNQQLGTASETCEVSEEREVSQNTEFCNFDDSTNLALLSKLRNNENDVQAIDFKHTSLSSLSSQGISLNNDREMF